MRKHCVYKWCLESNMFLPYFLTLPLYLGVSVYFRMFFTNVRVQLALSKVAHFYAFSVLVTLFHRIYFEYR